MLDKLARQHRAVNRKVRENDEVVADLMTHLTGDRPEDAPSAEAEIGARCNDPFDNMLSNLANLGELKPTCRVCAFTTKEGAPVCIAYAVQAGIYGEGLCLDRDYATSVVSESIASAMRAAVAQADYAIGAETLMSRYAGPINGSVVGAIKTESAKGADPHVIIKSVREKLSHRHGGCFRVLPSSQRTGRLLVEDAYTAPRGWFTGQIYV